MVLPRLWALSPSPAARWPLAWAVLLTRPWVGTGRGDGEDSWVDGQAAHREPSAG